MWNRKLGRPTAHRKSMLRSLTTSFLDKGKIVTTHMRAKELQRMAEKMITLAKKGGLANYRRALAYITVEDVAKKVFDEYAPKYADRNGGYTRVLKLGPRQGDGAEMAVIELV
jgi:large subunit ribosomal protein L17